MSDTLDSLQRAVIASPEDRTLRAECADALAASPDPVHVARAEFIRTQLDLENRTSHDDRKTELIARRDELFSQHWLDWWRPVCEPAGFPLPHVGESADPSADARPAHWPYSHSTLPPVDRVHSGTLIHAAEYKFAVRYAGGFPEEIRLSSFEAPAEAPKLVHRWGDAMPLHRVIFAATPSVQEWADIDGPHLARVPELIVSRLTAEFAPLLARSPHLAALKRLSVNPHTPERGLLLALVESPTWTGLRILHITGNSSPDAVRALARQCTLTQLEELELTLGSHQAASDSARGRIRGSGRLAQAPLETTPPPAHPPWTLSENGPAVRDLAGAPWFARLRRVTLKAAFKGLQRIVQEALETQKRETVDPIPDKDILALAEALDPQTLEQLVVSGNLISPAAQHDLTLRFGPRVSFV